jgi:hypothetical protein
VAPHARAAPSATSVLLKGGNALEAMIASAGSCFAKSFRTLHAHAPLSAE